MGANWDGLCVWNCSGALRHEAVLKRNRHVIVGLAGDWRGLRRRWRVGMGGGCG